MLVKDDRDEYAEMLIASRMARFSTDSMSLTIAPTLGCNFCCPYCYEKGQEHTTMNDGVANNLVAFVANRAQAVTSFNVAWYGGEPLLCLERIQSLTERLRAAIPSNCEYSASIVTNGYLMTPDVAKKLSLCEVKTAQVTLDGSRSDHDSRRVPHDGSPTYDRIMENVKKCADIIDIVIRVNVDKTNIAAADELLSYLEHAGLKNKVGFYLAPVDNINETCGNGKQCFSVREFSVEEVRFCERAIDEGFQMRPIANLNCGICGAVSRNTYVVDPGGDLYKCWDEIGKRDRRVGTLKEGLRMNAQLIRWLGYEPDDPECATCFAFPMCMGGCPHHAMTGAHKQCSSIRYNAEQKMLLAKRLHKMKAGVLRD